VVSPGTPVSSTNKTDHHDITEILLKVVLNTINPTLKMAKMDTGFLSKKIHSFPLSGKHIIMLKYPTFS
jgi:membrane-anchored protein YejM (alkaline phosphatase superfamily)